MIFRPATIVMISVLCVSASSAAPPDADAKSEGAAPTQSQIDDICAAFKQVAAGDGSKIHEAYSLLNTVHKQMVADDKTWTVDDFKTRADDDVQMMAQVRKSGDKKQRSFLDLIGPGYVADATDGDQVLARLLAIQTYFDQPSTINTKSFDAIISSAVQRYFSLHGDEYPTEAARAKFAKWLVEQKVHSEWLKDLVKKQFLSDDN